MKRLTFILLFYLCFSCVSQTETKFNLDFEKTRPYVLLPKGWMEWGDYLTAIDSTEVHSGKYSGRIASNDQANAVGYIDYSIPANYKGTSITLEGYMKIKNVADGFAGLMLRIEGNNEMLAYDNMKNQNIKGTKDWTKYTISLDFPKDAKTILVGGLLTGTGEAWFDDFVIKIDGKDIQNLKEIVAPVAMADLDTEFEWGSKVSVPKLNEELVNNLELLGKIWGFLKYNHPKIASGKYHWDYELFRFLPEYLKVKSKVERDQTLLQWIESYGKIDQYLGFNDTLPEAFLKPDMTWFDEFGMDAQLKNKLHFIYQNRLQDNLFYIDYGPVGNPEFKNEKKYYDMSYDDDGFKLLALYRYWNTIHYFFPYKHLTDKNWGAILRAYIPQFINSKSKFDYELACIELISSINDTHAITNIGFNNVKNHRGQFYPPLKVGFIEDQLVVTDYYNPEFKDIAKLKVGDIITHINHKPIASIIDSISAYYPASNKASQLRDISSDILRSNNNKINLTYISNQQEHQSQLQLHDKNDINFKWYNWSDAKAYKFINPDIGYITLANITSEDIPAIKEVFQNTKGIIIDIRNYPSTFVPFVLGSYFISKPTPFVKFTKFNKNNPGEFNFTDPIIISNDVNPYQGKLIVLVNEDTQSQAEYTAMAFRAGDRTTVVGSTTAGADGDISALNLPGGLQTYISGVGIYYPDGTETQRVGIIPDIEIRPTIKGIKEERDELLEKAIEIIKTD